MTGLLWSHNNNAGLAEYKRHLMCGPFHCLSLILRKFVMSNLEKNHLQIKLSEKMSISGSLPKLRNFLSINFEWIRRRSAFSSPSLTHIYIYLLKTLNSLIRRIHSFFPHSQNVPLFIVILDLERIKKMGNKGTEVILDFRSTPD